MRLRVTEAIDTPSGPAYAGQVTEMTLGEFAAVNDAEDGSVEEVSLLSVGDAAFFLGGLVERLA